MRLLHDIQYDFKDVLIVPKISTLTSRKDVNLNREFTFLNSKNKWNSIPIIVSNMDTVGTFNMAKELNKYNVSVALHKHYPTEKLIEFFQDEHKSKLNFYSMGMLEKDLEKFKNVYANSTIKNINVDVPNGYITKYKDFLKRLRDNYPTLNIMAGNVVTADMTEQLLLAGADIVKLGIGNGSSCITRTVAGVGYPQFSAILNAADAAHGLGGLVCGDGGLNNPGDFGKGFGAGADFLMSGGMFAGHEECEGEFVYGPKNPKLDFDYMKSKYKVFLMEIDERKNGPIFSPEEKEKIYGPDNSIITPFVFNDLNDIQNPFKLWDHKNNVWVPISVPQTPTHMRFYGMSSKEAMDKHSGGVAEYRASEGKEVLVPYKGKVENTIKEILGGIRSTCTYVGAKSLKELSKRTTFIVVNRTHNTIFGE